MSEAMLIVRTDENGAHLIDHAIRQNGGSAGIVTQPKHLGGDTAAWILAITAVTQALPPLLLAIRDLCDRGRIKSIEVDGVKVESPTPEVVEQLLRDRLEAK